MKKAARILMITATLIIAVALLVACNEGQQQNDYTVTYVTNGGSAVASQTVSAVASEPVTTRDGYTFAGWYDNPNFDGNRITFPYTPGKNVTLYAKWTASSEPLPPPPSGQYRVTFVTNGGSAVTAFTGTVIQTEPVTTLADSVFEGWYENADFSGSRAVFPLTLTKNMTLYAKWSAQGSPSDWVQTTADDYELYRDEDTQAIIAVVYTGNATKIVLPEDADIMYENTYLYLGENPTVNAIKIPDAITEINNIFWFSNMNSVKEFAVDDSHTTMSAKDGVLYSKNGETLILYPLGKTATSFTVPSTVKTVGYAAFYANGVLESITLSEGVSAIEQWGVSYMTKLKNVSLPSTLKTLGNGALKSNPLVAELEFPAGLADFGGTMTLRGSTGLKRLVGPAVMKLYDSYIPNLEYLEIIGEGVTGTTISLKNLTALKTVKINCAVDDVCFTGCTSLSSVTLPEGLGNLTSSAFSGCTALAEIEIPSTVETLGSYVFENCTSLKRVVIPEGVTRIGKCSFDGSAVEELHLPSTISTICTFDDVPNLKTLYAPAGLRFQNFYSVASAAERSIQNLILTSGTSIISTASKPWKSLHTLVIPASVTSIGANAFANCSSLVQITNLSSVDWTPKNDSGDRLVEPEVRRSESTSFAGKITEEANGFVKYVYNGQTYVLDCDRTVKSLKASDFAGYTAIGAYAFVKCLDLESAVIPSNIKTVGSNAFGQCRGLTSVTIQSGVEKIGQEAFAGCDMLKSVTIPQSVTTIDRDVFSTSGMTINVVGYSSKPSGWHNSWYMTAVDPPITVKWNA